MAKIKSTKSKAKDKALANGATVSKNYDPAYGAMNPAKASPFGLPRKRQVTKKK